MIDLPIRRGYEGPNRVSTGRFLRMRPLWLNYDGSEKLIDFQVKCVLTPSDIPFEKLRADKQDLLFVNNNNEQIPYWIEKADSTEIIVWLKFSEIIPGKEVFWLYYGNGNFSGASDVAATFIRIIDGLIACWHLDEGSGTVAHDTSGNGYDLAIHGAEWVDGVFKKALSFDGSNDYADVDMPQDFCKTGSSFSIELRVKSSDTTKSEMLIGNYPDGYVIPYFSFYTESGGCVSFRHRDAEKTVAAPITTTNVMDGSWHHLVGVRDVNAGRSRIYVDKVKEDDVADNTGDCSNTYDVTLMLHGNDRYHAGILDEIRIYNKALSDEEIADLCDNYGYTTTNYPGKVLVRKYSELEPSVSV